MELIELLRIDRALGAQGASPAKGPEGAFDKILAAATDPGVGNGDAVQKELADFDVSLDRADQDFEALMKMRRELEDAFARHSR